MTRKQILKLRPEFLIGGMATREWFEIIECRGFFCIRSGLVHADGETKSPYYYYDLVFGKGAEKKALQRFSEWWNEKNL